MQTNCFGGSLHFVWLLSLASRSPPLPLSLFSLSASRLSYSFSAGKVKCCLLPARSEGAQGYSASPLHLTLWQQCVLLRAPLHCHQPVVAATVAGRAAVECVYPLQLAPSFQVPSSSKLICFSTRRTERGPVFLQDSSRDHFTMFMVKSNDK